MTNNGDSIEEKYGLTKPNFLVDPETESDFWAYRSDVNIQQEVESLQVDLITGLAPKRFVWGPFGGGKTHTLHKISRELEGIASVHPVFVDCPDLMRRATFLDLYRDGIMRGIGQEFVMQLFEATLKSVGLALRDEMLVNLAQALGDSELSNAVVRLMDPNFTSLKLWAFMSGVSLSRADLDDLGQTQDLTSAESSRLAEMLILLGKLTRRYMGKTLVIILDEMDRTEGVGPETIITFETGFRRLFDPNQNYVSILIGLSAQARADMPEVFQGRGAVMSRLLSEGIIEIRALQEQDVERFIKEIIQRFRNEESDFALLLSNAKSATDETISEDLFPFSNEAIDAIKVRLSSAMTPREITMTMTRSLGRAFRVNKKAITSDII